MGGGARREEATVAALDQCAEVVAVAGNRLVVECERFVVADVAGESCVAEDAEAAAGGDYGPSEVDDSVGADEVAGVASTWDQAVVGEAGDVDPWAVDRLHGAGSQRKVIGVAAVVASADDEGNSGDELVGTACMGFVA